MQVEVIRSSRKTLCVEIREGRVILRAPMRATRAEIDGFLREKRSWIETHLARAQALEEAKKDVPPLTGAEIRYLADQAAAVLPRRVAHYAGLIGVTYGRITIRSQKTRWGSCSSRGNLNFNCLLMLTPPEVQDSVVVHELCHRKYMNHSPAFYAEILRVFPDYRRHEKWLKQHAPLLLSRLP